MVLEPVIRTNPKSPGRQLTTLASRSPTDAIKASSGFGEVSDL